MLLDIAALATKEQLANFWELPQRVHRAIDRVIAKGIKQLSNSALFNPKNKEAAKRVRALRSPLFLQTCHTNCRLRVASLFQV